MASIQSIRRPLTTLASRTTKQISAPPTTRPLFRAIPQTTRAFGTAPPSPCLARGIPSVRRMKLAPVQQNFCRWKSDGEPTFRQWGFEDINASLPTSPGTKPQKNLILVDVREPAELKSTGIIPSAVSVPLASQPDAFFLTPEEFETRFGYPKPGAGEEGDVVFYCKAGVRAKAAAQLAVQAGYEAERVGVYEGSWLDWADRKGRVERWEGESE
ncbi:Rhodanese-like domain-containing protein [Aspergillus pseudotamarii]|uniref:Rhodanese-like domain-containing protein n=1 Tax=Aspergillus pseudotamarii TaxID=132259 RepID=A0A5N6SHF5_ASPPS|nr:Rhodanese-like domain-containing protein [Aspergillus pseudotamarii]KAE8134102.1 Rhodanese-like domain-containing protein [Aspergillus pseudotamarii]